METSSEIEISTVPEYGWLTLREDKSRKTAAAGPKRTNDVRMHGNMR